MTEGKLRDMEHTLPATAVAEVASDAPARPLESLSSVKLAAAAPLTTTAVW